LPVPPSAARAASVLAVSTAVLGLAAAPVGAWTDPGGITPPRTAIDQLQLTHTASGTAVAGWTFHRGRGNGAANGVEMTARRGSAWGPARTVARAVTPRGVFLADLGSYGSNRLIALALRDSARGDRLEARFGPAGGFRGPARGLAVADFISSPRLAVDPAGTAVAAWTERAARGGSRAYAAARSAGGAFGPGEPLSRPGAGSTQVALNGRIAFVAWLRTGRVEGRMSRDGGRTWGRTQLVGRALGRRADISVAVSRRGAVAVAWMHQEPTEGGEHGPAISEARLRAPGRGFETVVRLERHEARAPEAGTSVETDFTGERAVIAWQGRFDAGDPVEADRPIFAVRTAELTPAGLNRRSTLTPPTQSAVLEDLAVRGGRAAVSWRVAPGDDVEGEIRASVAAGAAWGPPEVVAHRGRASRLAWNPGGGLEAVWIASTGSGEAVHAATR